MARNWLAGLLACFCLIALSIRLIDTPAQAETPSESACFSAVQGKVAWSRSGATSWSPQNVQALCRGAVDYNARIACFRGEIAAHDNWGRAITQCQSAGSSAASGSAGGQDSCFSAVQGKVAWNRAGKMSWNDQNVQALCRGAVDYNARIACFRNEIAAHDDWGRAISLCQSVGVAGATMAAPQLPTMPTQPTVRQPVSTTPAPPPPGGDDLAFNPFADPATPATPPSQSDDDLAFNPFGGGSSGATGGATSGQSGSSLPPRFGAQTGAAQTNVTPPPPPPPDVIAQYEGLWVERNAQYQRVGDGKTAPYEWKGPRTIRVERAGPNAIVLRWHDSPTWFTPMAKQSDTMFAYGAVSATFTKQGADYMLSVRGNNQTDSGEFEQAKTANNVLSKDRFAESDRESRRSLYSLEGLTKEWNSNFMGYDGLEMDMFDYLRGRKAQIFKQPGNYDYAIDDNMNVGLPYGLRGFRIRATSSTQTEALITNSSEFQKSMSFNFGGGGGAGSASLGANFSYEKTEGVRSNSSTLNAIGMAGSDRFVLLLDKGNQELSPNFRADLEALADGRKSAAQIVQTYGTHYANGIVYGGLGKAEKVMNSSQVMNFMSEKYEASGSGSAKGANLSGGFGEARSSSDGRESVFTREDFDAVGGSGSMTSNGWTVTDMDTVPVRYDLRPLSELVSPVFFPAKGDFNTSMKYNRARMALVNEIESRMNGAPRFSNQSIAPDIFQVEFHQLTCLKNGDEGNQPADLFGKIVFGWHGDGGVGSIEVLNAPENRRISCAGQGSGIPLGQKQMIIASPTGPEAQKSGFGNFYLIAAQLFEDDNSFTDPDDPIKEKISHVGRRLKDYADRGLQTDTLADPNPQWGPTLTVTYTIKRLK